MDGFIAKREQSSARVNIASLLSTITLMLRSDDSSRTIFSPKLELNSAGLLSLAIMFVKIILKSDELNFISIDELVGA